ncbi:acyl-CoA N-acyltransferase, partial [Cryphonectria parasitica EP155]
MAATTTETPDTPIPAPIVSLSRVLIRPYHLSDCPESSRQANDLEIARWMRNTFPSPYSLADGESFITNIGLKATKPSTRTDPPTNVLINYALCRRSDGHFIGGIGLKPFADVEARTMEIGYWLGKEHRGQGYMTEALKGFVAWAFQTFPETLRLEASAFEGNVGSTKVLAKA